MLVLLGTKINHTPTKMGLSWGLGELVGVLFKIFGLEILQLSMMFPRWREWCGLPTMDTWQDMLSVMSNHSVRGYSEVRCQSQFCSFFPVKLYFF